MYEDGYEERSEDDNLAILPDITSRSITDTLTSRYLSNKVYTRIGDILIALNPFQEIGIYSEEFINKYATQHDTFSLPPHIFSISQASFNNLRTKGHNQCCVISGESGSGKTETAKLLMRFLSQSCDTLVPDLPNQCHQMNPLIEAFGNAKTVMNGNSSRFGKYVELQFTPSGELVGAKITEYLLEKSRVISHAEGEQNFHIFYYIYAGLTPEYLNKLKLEISSTHRYLASNQVDSVILNDVSNQRVWRDKFQEMVACFQTLGFSKELLFQMLSVLITILYIGDIEFSADDDEYASVANPGMLLKVAGILGVQSKKLDYVLTSIVSTIQGGEVIFKRCNLEKASALRDATAKAIYSRLFSWIIAQINASLGKSHWSGKIISVLDIFGFENFKVNYFEQLCIDTANEQLQFYFNQHIFAWEVEEYRLEGVPLENIEFVNNKQTCDLLLKRPGGVLSLLDEESVFPKATDRTFLDKIRSNCYKNNEEIINFPRTKPLTFTINHFAGKVEYSCQEILEKNRDTLSDNIVQLLESCEHYLIRELFNKSSVTRIGNLQIKSKYLNCPKRAHSLKKTWGRSTSRAHSSRHPSQKKRETIKSPSGGGAPPTVGLMFRNSLCDLMEKMLSCDPHFVRCIKPNQRHFPGQVEEDFIERQLRSTGVLETVRIRQTGYSYRPPFATFLRLYGTLVFPHTSNPQASAENCARVLGGLGLEGWVTGESRVFLRYYHPSQLDLMRERELERIVTAQRIARGFLGRRETLRMRRSAQVGERDLSGLFGEIEKGCDAIFSHLEKLNSRDEEVFISLALESENKTSDSEDLPTPTPTPSPEPTALHSPLIEFPPPPGLPPTYTEASMAEVFAESNSLQEGRTDDREQQTSRVQSLPDIDPENRFSQYFEPENLPAKLRACSSLELPFTPVINKKRLSKHSLSSAGGSSYKLSGETEDSRTMVQVQVQERSGRERREKNSGDMERTDRSRLLPKPHSCLTPTGESCNWLHILCRIKDINIGDFLISQPSIVVDGSKNIFDSTCICLGALAASVSPKKSLVRTSYIGKGVEIFRDQVGDVFCKRMSKKPIKIVNFEDRPFYSRKLSALKCCLPLNELVKLLDFKKFREYVTGLSSSGALAATPVESMLELSLQFEVHKDPAKLPRIEIKFLEAIEHFKQASSQPPLNAYESPKCSESVSEYESSYREEETNINESIWVNIYRTHNKKHQKSQRRKKVVASSAFMSDNDDSQEVSSQIQNEEWSQPVEMGGQPLDIEFTGPVVRRARSSKRSALNTKSEDIEQLMQTSRADVKDRPKSTELETIKISSKKTPSIASLPESRNITPHHDNLPSSKPPEICIQSVSTSQSLQNLEERTEQGATRPKDLPGLKSGKVTITSIRRRNREVERKRVNELLTSPTAHTSSSKDEDRPVYLAVQPTLQPRYSQFHGRGAIPAMNAQDDVIQMHRTFIQQANQLSKLKGRLFSNDVSTLKSEAKIEGSAMLTRKKWHRPMTKRIVESRPLLSRATSEAVRKK